MTVANSSPQSRINRFSTPLAIAGGVAFLILAADSFFRMMAWWKLNNPTFAIWNGFWLCAYTLCALGLLLSAWDRNLRRGSAVEAAQPLPTAVIVVLGAILLLGGAIGVLTTDGISLMRLSLAVITGIGFQIVRSVLTVQD
jgi:hypothetical protein